MSDIDDDMLPAPTDNEYSHTSSSNDAFDGLPEGSSENENSMGDSKEDDAFALLSNNNTEVEVKETPLSKWEDERKLVLQARSEKARAEKKQAGEKAKEELADFYRVRDDSVKKAMSVNRSEERNTKQDVKTTMENGTQWEKVAKFCDLKPKLEGKGGVQKTDRFRRLLMGLKNEKGAALANLEHKSN